MVGYRLLRYAATNIQMLMIPLFNTHYSLTTSPDEFDGATAILVLGSSFLFPECPRLLAGLLLRSLS